MIFVARAAIAAPFIAVLMTIVHLMAFSIASFLRSIFGHKYLRQTLLLVVTNKIFFGVLTWFYVSISRSGNVTESFNNEYLWIKGTITALGALVLALQIGVYTFLNLMTVLIVRALESFARRSRPMPSSSESA